MATASSRRSRRGEGAAGAHAAGKKRKDGEEGAPPDFAEQLAAFLDPVDPLSQFIERYDREKLFDAVSGAKRYLLERPAEAQQLFLAQPALVRGLNVAIDLLCGPHWPSPDEQENAMEGAPRFSFPGAAGATAQGALVEPDGSASDGGARGSGVKVDGSSGAEAGAVGNGAAPLGSVCLPGVGYIVPTPEHAPHPGAGARLGSPPM